jgi:hypothetical protein
LFDGSLNFFFEVFGTFDSNSIHVDNLNSFPFIFSEFEGSIFVVGVAVIDLFSGDESHLHSQLIFPELLSEASEESIDEVVGQGELAFIAIEKFFFAGKGGPNHQDCQVHPFHEAVERVDEAALVDLLIIEVGGQYLPKRHYFLYDYVNSDELSPSSSRMEM